MDIQMHFKLRCVDVHTKVSPAVVSETVNGTPKVLDGFL